MLRTSRLVLASVVLAVSGLGVAATVAPAAHAASTPSISVTGQGGGAQVYGWQFTPGATVRVEILDSSLSHVVSTQYLTTWWNSTHAYGVFDVLMSTSYIGPAWVAVDQAGRPTVWAKTYIYPAPYIQATGETAGVQVAGSGFYPGATVRVEVLDLNLNVLNAEYVSTVSFGIDSGTFTTALKAPCGYVYVVVDGGSPGEAWAKAYVSC
jgi:hypothetical protein